MDDLKESWCRISLLSAAGGGSGGSSVPALRSRLGPEQERPNDSSRKDGFFTCKYEI